MERKTLGKAAISEEVDDVVNAVATGKKEFKTSKKPRREILTTRIDIELRDEINEYISSEGITLISFIDQALREHLYRLKK